MAVLTTTIGAEFTPAVGYFAVQAKGGKAQLLRKATGAAAFVWVGDVDERGLDAYQACSAAVWKFDAPGTVTVSAVET